MGVGLQIMVIYNKIDEKMDELITQRTASYFYAVNSRDVKK